MATETYVKLFLLGFLSIFLGLTLIIISIFLSKDSITFGGVILVGPIPIIIGAGPYVFLAVVLALILTIISIILFVSLRREKQNR